MMLGHVSKNSHRSWILLLPAILLCACGSAKEVSFKSGGVTQTFSQGPSNNPSDSQNYIYPGATASGSVSAEGENEEQSKFIMLSTQSSMATVSKWYKEKFSSDNWKIVNEQEQPKLVSITGAKDNSEMSVMISDDNGKTNISLSLAKQVDSNYADDTKNENFVPNKDTPPTD
jgi:hypothetical protein